MAMLLAEQEFVMSFNNWFDPDQEQDQKQDQDQDQKQDQDQDQDQKQANLQGQLQGQGQFQLAVQSLDSKSENDNENDNDNDNDNDNKNSNENKNENEIENKVDNKLANEVDNDVDNKIENKVENTIDNKVNVDVDIDVDLDLDADGLSSPVIDLSCLSDVHGSIIMPDVVNQTLNGNGNQFNIDQVNNLVDNDNVSSPSVSFSGTDFDMDAKAEGGDVKIDSRIDDISGNTASGVNASADAVLSQEAFNQTITQGANIQFNSITMNVAGDDFTDSHNLG
jgi:hypothetical protein